MSTGDSPDPFDRDDVHVAQRIVVDIAHPGKVSIGLRDISDDAMGDVWVVFEAEPDLARKVAAAIETKADEAERAETKTGVTQ